MKDLGKIHFYLGIATELYEENWHLKIHQKQSIMNLFRKYKLEDAKKATTPMDINVKLRRDDGVSKAVDPTIYQSMVGSLIYVAMGTRPDIAHAVGVAKFKVQF